MLHAFGVVNDFAAFPSEQRFKRLQRFGIAYSVEKVVRDGDFIFLSVLEADVNVFVYKYRHFIAAPSGKLSQLLRIGDFYYLRFKLLLPNIPDNGEPFEQTPEFQPLEGFFHLRSVHLGTLALLKPTGYIGVRPYRSKLARHVGGLLSFNKLCSQRSLYFVDMRVNVINRAVFQKQRYGSLFSYSFHAGDVVRGVAAQRLVLHNLLRFESVVFKQQRGSHRLRLADAALCEQDGRLFVHKLKHILVACDNKRRHAESFCKRADNVVRLDSRAVYGFYLHVGKKLLQDGHLSCHIVGHRTSRRFVSLINILAEVVPALVKRHRDMGGV